MRNAKLYRTFRPGESSVLGGLLAGDNATLGRPSLRGKTARDLGWLSSRLDFAGLGFGRIAGLGIFLDCRA